jgi:hypothetical protein
VLEGEPSNKTVGFQTVSDRAVTFLCKRSAMPTQVDVALCYVEGSYPSGPGESACRQWRIDGTAIAQPEVSSVLETAPVGSLAQILAAGERGRSPLGEEVGDAFHGGEGGWGLLPSSEKESFVELVESYKRRLVAGEIEEEELARDVALYSLEPERVELCEEGAFWNRTEWWKDEAGEWKDGLSLLPY